MYLRSVDMFIIIIYYLTVSLIVLVQFSFWCNQKIHYTHQNTNSKPNIVINFCPNMNPDIVEHLINVVV